MFSFPPDYFLFWKCSVNKKISMLSPTPPTRHLTNMLYLVTFQVEPASPVHVASRSKGVNKMRKKSKQEKTILFSQVMVAYFEVQQLQQPSSKPSRLFFQPCTSFSILRSVYLLCFYHNKLLEEDQVFNDPSRGLGQF